MPVIEQQFLKEALLSDLKLTPNSDTENVARNFVVVEQCWHVNNTTGNTYQPTSAVSRWTAVTRLLIFVFKAGRADVTVFQFCIEVDTVQH